jgi:uncharacterized membrane protein
LIFVGGFRLCYPCGKRAWNKTSDGDQCGNGSEQIFATQAFRLMGLSTRYYGGNAKMNQNCSPVTRSDQRTEDGGRLSLDVKFNMEQVVNTEFAQGESARCADRARGGDRRWRRLAVGVTVMYVVMFSTLAILRHEGLRTQMNDLGNMTQAIWGAAQGDMTMRVTNDPDHQIRSRLGVHTNFIFYLVAIPFAIFPGLIPHMEWLLLILTSAAAGLAGLGIFHFVRRHLPEYPGSALLIALAYWLNPMVHDATLFDFHVVTLVTLFVVWMLWAWSAGYEKTGWVLFFLAMICKEDVPLILFMLGIGEMIWGRRRRGFYMAGVSVAYLFLLFGFIIPLLNFGEPLPKVASGRLGWLGNSPLEIVTTVLTQPLKVLAHVFSYNYLRLPFFLYLMGGVFALFGGMRVLIGVIPPVAVALLSGNDWMSRVTGTYYWITPVALIYMGCALSVKNIAGVQRVHRTIVGMLVGISLVACVLLSTTPLGLFSRISDFAVRSEYRKSMGEIKELIPASAAVSAQNNIAAHLAKRRMVAFYPAQLEHADYLVFHLRYPGGPDRILFLSSAPVFLLRRSVDEYISLVDGYLRSPDWRKVYRRDGFFVFERAGSSGVENVEEIDLEEERRIFEESLSQPEPSSAKRILYEILGYRH